MSKNFLPRSEAPHVPNEMWAVVKYVNDDGEIDTRHISITPEPDWYLQNVGVDMTDDNGIGMPLLRLPFNFEHMSGEYFVRRLPDPVDYESVPEVRHAYLVIMDRGGIFGVYTNESRAREAASNIDGMVVFLPIHVDFRPESAR